MVHTIFQGKGQRSRSAYVYILPYSPHHWTDHDQTWHDDGPRSRDGAHHFSRSRSKVKVIFGAALHKPPPRDGAHQVGVCYHPGGRHHDAGARAHSKVPREAWVSLLVYIYIYIQYIYIYIFSIYIYIYIQYIYIYIYIYLFSIYIYIYIYIYSVYIYIYIYIQYIYIYIYIFSIYIYIYIYYIYSLYIYIYYI